MGGSGSGYWFRWSTKGTTESMHQVDIRYMKKKGLLLAGCTGRLFWTCREEETGSIVYRVERDRLVLNYRSRQNGGDWEPIEDNIFFTWTECNFGGKRYWFRCPSCHRRVAVLYGGKYFRCRHCYNLVYSSQNESPMFRLISKTQKIRQRLGGSANMTEPFPSKPKDMHWKTYWKLKREADISNARSWGIYERKYGVPL